MLDYKIIFKALITGLFFIVIYSTSRAQEFPSDMNEIIIDSIDYEENLLDSNAAYKKQFDSLSKEGEWVEAKKSDLIRDLTNNTGEEFDIFPEDDRVIYVWRPYGVNNYWTPYSNGSWMFSNCGWVWTSYYNWGWGPYNYGRWYFSNFYGWIWFPGSVWAPNWVTWRYSGNYVGWYPSCPRVYWSGLHKKIYTNHQFAYIPRNWVFVDKKDFKKKIDNTNIASGEHNVKLLKESKKVKTALFTDPTMPKFKYTGPDADLVSKETGSDIKPVQISVKQSGGRYVAEYVDTKEPVKSGNANTDMRNPKSNNSKEETEVINQKEEVKKSNSKEPKVINPPVEKNTKNKREKVNTTKPKEKEKTVKTNQTKDKNNPADTNDQKKSNINGTTKSSERIPVKK